MRTSHCLGFAAVLRAVGFLDGVVLWLGVVVVLFHSQLAVAQDAGVTESNEAPPEAAGDTLTTAVLAAMGGAPEAKTFGAAIQRVTRQKRAHLEGLRGQVHTPAVGLDDVQLAIGCIGLTPACLDLAAEQLDVDDIILPVLERAGEEEVVFSLLRFDRATKSLVETGRKVTTNTETDLLEPIDAMLRELYGLPPAPVKPPVSERDDSQSDEPPGGGAGALQPQTTDDGSGFPIVPVVVGGVGIVLLGVGTAFALSASGTQTDFDNAPAMRVEDIDRLHELESTGATEATLANVFLGAGLATVVGATVLFFVLDNDDEEGEPSESEPTVSLRPALSPSHVGLSLQGHWGAM